MAIFISVVIFNADHDLHMTNMINYVTVLTREVNQMDQPILPGLPPLLTVPEAASVLRIKVSTMRSWLLKRKIRFTKPAGRVCILRSDVEEFIAKGFR